jgi:hypothetical protein
MKIYISGPITATPNYARRFLRAQKTLEDFGFEVVNPALFTEMPHWDWLDCIIRDLIILKTCDAVYLLRNWQKSAGCRIEVEAALRMDLDIFTD